MTPTIPSQPDKIIPVHDHSRTAEGGPVADANVALLNRENVFAVQTVHDGGASISAGLTLGANSAVDEIQWTRDGFIHLLGMVTTTDARTINDPDATGTRVTSKPIVALTNQAATASGNVLVGPEAGHYLLFVQVENRTALAAGTVLAAIAHTGAGGALSQSPLPALTLTARGVQSFFVLCKVASGDVAYSFTVAAAVGTPSYDASVIPLGRVA